MTDKIDYLKQVMGLTDDSVSDLTVTPVVVPKPASAFAKNKLWQQRFFDLLDVEQADITDIEGKVPVVRLGSEIGSNTQADLLILFEDKDDPVNHQDSDTTIITGTGLPGDPLTVEVKVPELKDGKLNSIKVGTDGLFVQSANIAWNNVTKVISFTTNNNEKVDIDLSQFVSDIHVDNAEFDPLTSILTLKRKNEDGEPIDDITIDLGELSKSSVQDTNTATISGNGTGTTPLRVAVKISAEADNALVAMTDGLYVSKVTGAQVSQEAGNAIQEKPDGLYVAMQQTGNSVQTVTGVAGSPVSVDNTDPLNPVVKYTDPHSLFFSRVKWNQLAVIRSIVVWGKLATISGNAGQGGTIYLQRFSTTYGSGVREAASSAQISFTVGNAASNNNLMLRVIFDGVRQGILAIKTVRVPGVGYELWARINTFSFISGMFVGSASCILHNDITGEEPTGTDVYDWSDQIFRIWDSGSLPLVTSATDVTPGRVTTVGYGGIGIPYVMGGSTDYSTKPYAALNSHVPGSSTNRPTTGDAGTLTFGVDTRAVHMMVSYGSRRFHITADNKLNDWLEVWTSANLVKTIGLNDATPGSILKVGDLGSNIHPAQSQNFDSLATVYPYSGAIPVLLTGGSNGSPDNSNNRYFHVMQMLGGSSGGHTQIAIPHEAGVYDQYIRSVIGGVPTTWYKYWTSRNMKLAGGSTGQVLTKKSGNDGDFEWKTPETGGGGGGTTSVYGAFIPSGQVDLNTATALALGFVWGSAGVPPIPALYKFHAELAIQGEVGAEVALKFTDVGGNILRLKATYTNPDGTVSSKSIVQQVEELKFILGGMENTITVEGILDSSYFHPDGIGITGQIVTGAWANVLKGSLITLSAVGVMPAPVP